MDNMFEMFNNPEIMESMQNLMKNEDIQKMMQNKDFINNLKNINGLQDQQTPPQTQESLANNVESENDKSDSLGKFLTNETIITKNLKNEKFNNKVGVIQDYNSKTKRYIVLFEECNKLVSIREENIENNFDNIEQID